ncbi:MAG: class I tRNA ligase family protein, partial [Sphaerochaetaceae bacterium]|nr:class I tRNA ligase family protein [Sphaerochaetaceae bacterium]
IEYWMPVDLYVGGAEHAVLHLLYARFWHKVLYDIGVVNTKEPFQRLVNQGMITSFAYQRKDKSLVPVDEVEETAPEQFVEKATNEPLERVIAKMSKSLKNVINPDEIIRDYGADAMRLYEMFMGPLQVSKPWSTSGLSGVYRFLDRIWRLTERTITDEQPDKELLKTLHKTIKKVSEDTNSLDFNTAISQMMIMVNDLYKRETLPRAVWEPFILLLSPYVPHLSEELWQQSGNTTSVVSLKWPEYDESLTVDDVVQIVVQVNGKLRARFDAPKGSDKDSILAQAKEIDRIKELTEGKSVIKEIVIPDKLVNIVVKG